MNENQKKYKEQSKKIGFVLLGISVIVFMTLAQLIVKNWLNTIILTAILVGIMILNGILVALPMKVFIKKYNHEIESVKGGDFTPLLEVQKYKSNKLFAKLTTAISEILGEFKELIENNFKMIKAITFSTEQIEEATSQSVRTMEGISANLQDIAEGATEQAAKSQACEALIEVLSTEIETAYSNCKSMMEATRKITALSDEGSKSVSSLRNKTKETSESTKEISKAVAMLTEKIKDIATFVDSIENIATQTNLLALNAAIEAARAGDAGRGFGVVAEEIRKLADESRSATEEIKNLVQGVYEEADGATKVMQTMNKATGEEELAVNQTGKAFEHITEGIRFIIDKIDHTDHAISKVNRDKDEVIATVQEIAAVTQTTAAHTEEIASTAETQTSTMENLKESIDTLNEQVEGLNKKILKYNI